jgi:RES domain-containing protein
MVLWRISNYATLDGEGGRLFSARWHSKGQAIVYTSDHPASSLCEMLANTDAGSLPTSFQLLKISAEEGEVPSPENLRVNWIKDVSFTRTVGDTWLRDGASAILRVPSALVPEAFNFLLNPAHTNMAKIRIVQSTRVPLDQRLR